jgi:hypothetical protein
MADAVLKLAYEVSRVTEEKVALIDDVMRRTGVLALNARLEAARAGTAGAAFSVVAQEMGSLAGDIRKISSDLRDAVANNIAKLQSAGSQIQFELRGERFADLARSAVEIIDRNLYERSCDVRWWATDSAVVDALARGDAAARTFASERLATILRSYTVYLDLWVVDADGRVIANGRPQTYPGVIGLEVSRQAWFRDAMGTRDGDQYVVADVATAQALGDAPVATYATAIRSGAQANGRAIGALGIFFDWEPQAAAIVGGVGLSEEEKRHARVLLLDGAKRVIAASDRRGVLSESYDLKSSGAERGFYVDGNRLVAHALTPGYETYRGLGWSGLIEYRLSETPVDGSSVARAAARRSFSSELTPAGRSRHFHSL